MRSTDLTLRKDLDRPIEWDEMDDNLENLDSDSPWIVHNGHISYSGKVSLYGTDAEYDFDFMDGVNNIATLGTQDAELQVHIDGANSFKVITNTQERITLTTDGLTGIGVTEPEHPLDVEGIIRTSSTLLGNQAYCNSFYDGTLTISGGSITNSQTIVNMGVIQWTSLYDRTTGITVREFENDELSGDNDKLPTSYRVKLEMDSDHAWNVSEHDSIQQWTSTNLNRIDDRLDSEHAWNVAEHDSLQQWTSTNINRLDDRLDSEHAWTSTNLNLLDGRLDSEHAWAINEFDSVNGKLGTTDLQNVTDVGATTTNDITAPHFVGQLTGTLTTPRNINGTAFNGGTNITTVQWGTPRTLTIGDTAKSVNGSTNYAWTKAEIGITKANIDALGLSVNNADKLTTPRNINGTAFDGTANITTAQWGTGRSISIGGTAKTVNGSANYSWAPSEITAGKVSNSFTVQGTAFDGSAAKSVTFTGGTGISISGTTITNDLGGVPVSISGGGITTVSGTYPNFTISTPNTNVNTTYTAGSGMTLTGTQFINAAPDRTVSITGTGATTVTGTYPNFTVSSTDTNTNTTYTAGNGLTLSGTQFLMSGSYSGTFTATGDVVAFSDIALKEDINPITAALDKVSQLTGYTFRRKGEERVSTGVMAQEVQAVLPEAVHDNEGTLGVAYGNMVGLLIEAVKELSGKVETLESELNKTK